MKKLIAICLVLVLALGILASCDIQESFQGKQGEQGIQGEKGDKGDAGKDGVDGKDGKDGATIAKFEFNADGKLVITLTDGTVLAPVEIPEKEEHIHTFGELIDFGSNNGLACDKKMYYTICSECFEVKLVSGSEENHNFSQEYSYNTSYHWNDCSRCNTVKNKATHELNENGKCNVCNYQYINPNYGWTDVTGTLYLGVNVTLRSQPSDANNTKTDKNMYFGTALTRVSTNGKWEAVKINGDDTIYYVKTIYTTSKAGNFDFTDDANTPAITLNETTTNNVCFYKSPFFCEDNDVNYGNMLCKSGIKANNLSEGYSLKKLAVSSNGGWVKVEFVGTVTMSANNTVTYTAENPGIFYIQSLAFIRGDVLGGGEIAGGNNPGSGDFFD